MNYEDLYNALMSAEDDSSEVSYEERFKNQYHPDLVTMCDEFRVLDDDKDCLNAESVMDLSVRLNKDKEYMKEVIGMGVIKEMFDENRKTINELKNQLQNKDEQLNNKDEQLQKEIDENTKLRKEIEDLKKLVSNKIAMF